MRITRHEAKRRTRVTFAMATGYGRKTWRPVAHATRPARTLPDRPAMRRGTLGRLLDLAA